MRDCKRLNLYLLFLPEPCLVLALRGVGAFTKLAAVVPERAPSRGQGSRSVPERITARTAEEAYTFLRQFFTERELYSDPLARPLLPYIPNYTSKHVYVIVATCHTFNMFNYKLNGPFSNCQS